MDEGFEGTLVVEIRSPAGTMSVTAAAGNTCVVRSLWLSSNPQLATAWALQSAIKIGSLCMNVCVLRAGAQWNVYQFAFRTEA